MNAFDKHIRNKMEQMEIQPSKEVSEHIKSHKPRPRIKNVIIRYAHWMVAGIIVITAISLFVFNNAPIDKNNNVQNDKHDHNLTDNNPKTPVSDKETKDFQSPKYKSAQLEQPEKTDVKNDNTAKTTKIFTYSNKITLTSGKEGKWLNKSKAEIINTKGHECVVYCPEYGNYEVIRLNNNGDSIYYVIDHLQKPQIFTTKDTVINALKCRIACKTNHGNWQVPDGIKLTELNNDTIHISAHNFGRYVMIRTEKDSVDRFSDTLAVHFLAPDSIYRVITRPRCPGKCAVVTVDNGFVPQSDKMTCKLIDKEKYELKFKPAATGKAICHIVKENTAEPIDTLVFEIPEKTDINYVLKHRTCNNPGSIYLSGDPDIDEVYLNKEKIQTGTPIDLNPGEHKLMWKDVNGCINYEQIVIKNKNILNADFDLELSLDGFSARTENLTHITASQTSSDELHYEWYVNEKLQSTAKEPELQLDQLTNSVKLFVTNGDLCQDSMIKDNIKPDESPIRAPNFFTPNNDGYFDQFKVLVDSRLSDFNAIITTRSGQTVYTWNNPDEGWDGKIFGNENASQGVYFYIIQAFDSTGQVIEKKGTLQLIR